MRHSLRALVCGTVLVWAGGRAVAEDPPSAAAKSRTATVTAAVALPPEPLPMAGRVFPVYPLYPAAPYAPTTLAYGKETFSSADVTGYFLYAAPVTVWLPWSRAVAVPHPQAAAVAARFAGHPEAATAGSAYCRGCAAYWAGNLPQARESLAAAVARNERDARAWSYLALTEWALGDAAGGDKAARRAAEAATVSAEATAKRADTPERWSTCGASRTRRVYRATTSTRCAGTTAPDRSASCRITRTSSSRASG